MKRLLIFGLMTAIVSLAILSCKDDFNEEDFLKLQSDLKLKQDTLIRARNQQLLDSTSEKAVKEYVAAINEAGDLLAVTLMVRENGVPVPGVSVSLTSSTANAIVAGRTQAVQTGVTDASGNVVFDRVAIGSGTISFSKAGYITATGLVDFGTPSAPQSIQVTVNGTTITKYLPPNKRFEEAVVQMFSATAGTGSTATITGRVSIENDVTNTTPEVPAGVVIRANLTGLVVPPGGFITSMQFADNSSLGVATVAADGTYTMTVPATATGTSISLILPNIDGTLRMAVNGYDNGTGTIVPLALPEYRNVPTSWGPQASGIAFETSIPSVAGARVILPTAPAPGSGLTFDVTPVGRALDAATITSTSVEKFGNTFYKIANRGSYTGTVPTVTITGGGGSGATATAVLRTLVNSLTVTNRGTNYGPTVQIQLRATLSGGGTALLAADNVNTTNGMLPETINLEDLDNAGGGFGIDDGAVDLPVTATGLTLTVTGLGGANGAVSGTFVTELKSVTIETPGSGYTSAPTFVFGGTGVNTPAELQVVDFPVFWDLNPNNTASTDYPLVPDFIIHYPQTAEVEASNSGDVQIIAQNGTVQSFSEDFQYALMLSNGDLVKRWPGTIRTLAQSSVAPTITVVNDIPENAKFTFSAANIDPVTGKITGVPAINLPGNGYNTRMTASIVPTITGAPGMNAAMNVLYTLGGLGSDFNEVSGEWTFNSNPAYLSITNPGSGYLPNLNQKGQEVIVFTGGPAVANAQAGKSYTVNISYGTGVRKVKVN